MDYGPHYGFSQMPFGEEADREAFFPSETHKEALALTLYGIRERKGFIVVFGGEGMGKSTLVRQAVGKLDGKTKAAVISQAHDQYYTLLREIMEKLGLKAAGGTSKGSMLHELYEQLILCLKQGENIVIFLDDAHRLKDGIIEELRLLSNLETSRRKLIQFVIVGEPELGQRLNSKHLRQIRQRIQILHHLLPLGQDESLQYIEHRLARAGRGSADVFTPEALAAICKAAGGIPRNLNALCDGALALGAERSEKPVSAGIVGDARKAAGPLVRAASPAPASGGAMSVFRSPWLYAALAVALAGVFLGSLYLAPRLAVVPGAAVVPPAPQQAPAAGEPAGAQPAQGEQAPAPAAQKQEPPAAAPAPAPVEEESADASVPAGEITVKEGTTLSAIASRHYGVASATVLDGILEANPGVTDVDLVRAGSRIVLPADAGKARLVTRPDGSFAVHAATFMTNREARDYAGKIGPDAGRASIVKKRVAPGKDWYRVEAGPFAGRGEARSALQSLERQAPAR